MIERSRIRVCTFEVERGVIDGICDECIFPDLRVAQMTLERNGMPTKLARRHTSVLAAQRIKSLERSWAPVADYLSKMARS